MKSSVIKLPYGKQMGRTQSVNVKNDKNSSKGIVECENIPVILTSLSNVTIPMSPLNWGGPEYEFRYRISTGLNTCTSSEHS